MQRKLLHKKSKARFVKTCTFRRFDKDLFRKAVAGISWDSLYAVFDPNDAWELFKIKFLQIFDTYAPFTMIKVRGRLQGFSQDEKVGSPKNILGPKIMRLANFDVPKNNAVSDIPKNNADPFFYDWWLKKCMNVRNFT